MSDFVVDACVARSASPSKDRVAHSCIETLNKIRGSQCNAVFCRVLLDEWNRHRSRFSAIWLKAMFARKRVVLLSVNTRDFLDEIEVSGIKSSYVEALIKDRHVVVLSSMHAAALVTTDERLRKALRSLPDNLRNYRDIEIVNPIRNGASGRLSGGDLT
jgi:hypothetical protein